MEALRGSAQATEGANTLDSPEHTNLQQTVAGTVSIEGIGLHTGVQSRVTLIPAGPGEGVVFVRADLAGRPRIPAHPSCVTGSVRHTVLTRGRAEVQTVEHLLAAVWAMGIDNVTIEVDGPEVPIGDGSSLPFVQALQSVGSVEQPAERVFGVFSLPRWVSLGDAWVAAVPATEFWVSAVYEHPHPVVGRQEAAFCVGSAVFAREIAPARTFGFLEERELLRAKGLGKGASIENAVVIGEKGYLTPLRFPDELVRHKLLDLIGDLALMGVRLRLRVVACRAGHAAHHRLAAELVAARVGLWTEVLQRA